MPVWYGHQETDRIIQEFFPSDYLGVFIDVGAAHPTIISNSHHFRESGWKVVPIEANPRFCDMYRKLGLHILEYAVSDKDDDNGEFVIHPGRGYNIPDTEGMTYSSICIRYAGGESADNKKIPVKIRTLNTILREHHPEIEKIDVLSVDVEGWEMEVVKGLDLQRYKPRLILLEEVQGQHYQPQMSELGYALKTFHDTNAYYVPA